MASRLVSTRNEAVENIDRYVAATRKNRLLRERAGYVQSWYANKDASRQWQFAPSKFIGYREATAEAYLADSGTRGERDGRQTERVLSAWFSRVPDGGRLGRELTEALRRFLAQFDQVPNARARINVLMSDVESALPVASDLVIQRIASDPAVCGGRPCIKGTRMRVSDIVEALAQGATRESLLRDFDYLTAQDIAAALLYAARATDHRVVRTA